MITVGVCYITGIPSPSTEPPFNRICQSLCHIGWHAQGQGLGPGGPWGPLFTTGLKALPGLASAALSSVSCSPSHVRRQALLGRANDLLLLEGSLCPSAGSCLQTSGVIPCGCHLPVSPEQHIHASLTASESWVGPRLTVGRTRHKHTRVLVGPAHDLEGKRLERKGQVG